jgi:regulator of sigma E protease
MSILLFIIILAILILAHEFGHFIVAKKAGIRVDEFGVGFPPKLYGKKFGETEYTINAIPLGGFVKIFGENPDEENINGPDRARSFVHKPKIIQAAVLVAGVFFNLLLAWFLISAGFMIGLPTSSESVLPGQTIQDSALVVTEILKDAPAEKAGILSGDRIVSLSSGGNSLTEVTPEAFQEFVAEHSTQEIQVHISRKGEEKIIAVTPKSGAIEGEERPAVGIAMDMIGVVRLPWYSALVEGGKLTIKYTGETFKGLYLLLHDAILGKADMSAVSGPVGIVSMVGNANHLGFVYLIGLTALISINLAVVNVLPIPALDGGRLFFLLIEVIKRSPIKPKIANTAHAVGFVALILLIIAITFHDVMKLVAG